MSSDVIGSQEVESAVGGEYERERVPNKALLGDGKFWGMYAGEHAAGTEFMIGPLFLAAGASLQDLFFGLLIGNVLAVLTWRYLVTPIAMAKRMTLYYQLERIAGGGLVKFYNFTNGILFCFLAGAMVTVSASAVGVPFKLFYEAPESLFALVPDATFTILVLVVGVVMSLVAAAGYQTVARIANIAAPWMIVIFLACGLVALGEMGVNSFDTLVKGEFWTEAIRFVQEKDGAKDFGLTKIIVFAWLCNGAMHFGMADLSIFRFAKKSSAGWAPSVGMFLGHYMAWIAAGLMMAAQIKLRQDTNPNPGLLAWNALGWTGILCVVIAGWTTANPTIYRAGLAFQGMVPRSPRFVMTLVAGAVATIAGVFPNLSAKLLDFVGMYGTILGPMGAILFVDFYFMRRFGLVDEYAERSKSGFNLSVVLAWLIPVAVAMCFIYIKGTFPAFCVVPAWIGSAVLYIVFSKMFQGSVSSSQS